MITLLQMPYLVTGQAIWRYDPHIGTVTKHVISEVSMVYHKTRGPTTPAPLVTGYIIILDDKIANSIMVMDPLHGDSVGNEFCYLFEYEVPLGTSTVDKFVERLFTQPMKRG